MSFLTKDRIQRQAPDEYIEGAPELAVEVVSPSDSAEDLELKVNQYLSAGAQAVWVIYPKTLTLHAYHASRATVVLEKDQVLEAPELFPGWSIRLRDLLGV